MHGMTHVVSICGRGAPARPQCVYSVLQLNSSVLCQWTFDHSNSSASAVKCSPALELAIDSTRRTLEIAAYSYVNLYKHKARTHRAARACRCSRRAPSRGLSKWAQHMWLIRERESERGIEEGWVERRGSSMRTLVEAEHGVLGGHVGGEVRGAHVRGQRAHAHHVPGASAHHRRQHALEHLRAHTTAQALRSHNYAHGLPVQRARQCQCNAKPSVSCAVLTVNQTPLRPRNCKCSDYGALTSNGVSR